MAAYHQMGHDSWNLVGEEALKGFGGMILSPVNSSPAETIQRLDKWKLKDADIEIVLDPQFYNPRSSNGELATWKHFSNDVDTANLSDGKWWDACGADVIGAAQQIGAHAICSPAILPKTFEDDYYRWTADCADRLAAPAKAAGVSLLLSAIIKLVELSKKGRAESIASILTSVNVDRIYLVLFDDLAPREQRNDFQALAGAGRLIRLLEEAGCKVLVSFSGLDMLLWKAAGATDVATGKFFNLRRFVPGRWEDNDDGGRNLPYWTDGGLITWLREDDFRLLDMKGWVDRASAGTNPFAAEMLKLFDAGENDGLLKLSWRQYLFWFFQTEKALTADPSLPMKMLKHADSLWAQIADAELYMFDRKNNGDWIRPWINAIGLI